jgi:hypothetical protein
MRVPRVRLTVRRMMVATGIIALFLGGLVWTGRMRQRSAAYHRRAEAYAWIAFHSGSAVFINDEWVDSDPVVRVRDAWARRMAEKYWRLSDYPWLPVEPDPTPPPEALSQLSRTLEPWWGAHMADWSLRFTDPPSWTFLWTWHP